MFGVYFVIYALVMLILFGLVWTADAVFYPKKRWLAFIAIPALMIPLAVLVRAVPGFDPLSIRSVGCVVIALLVIAIAADSIAVIMKAVKFFGPKFGPHRRSL